MSAMDLRSPSTLLAAWALAPLLTVIAAGGLGVGISALTRCRLGAMTLPIGYAAGIVLMVALLKLGLGGRAATAIAAGAALAGYGMHASGIKAACRTPRDSLLAAARAAAAAAGGFLLAMAPIVGSGRAGVLGYILNNDPAVHASLVELLRDHGTDVAAYGAASSFAEIGVLVDTGYPLGSHVWPLWAGVLSGLDTFYVWAPSVAVAASMLSLVAFAVLRRLSASRWPTALAAALIPAGYLFFSFVAQGSAKDAMTAVLVYASVVVGVEVLERGLSARRAVLAAIAPIAAFLTFGAGATAWLVAPALVFLFAAGRRRAVFRASPRAAAGALVVIGIAAVAAVPAVDDALEYVRSADSTLRDSSQPGNLLGAIPWQQSFNVWFAYDYRADPATLETLSSIGPWLAAALAAAGLGLALHRRERTIPLCVLTGGAGALVISIVYSIYVEAKAYAILAPALGIATAAAVLGLLDAPGVRRAAGAVAAAAVGAAILGGAALVYAGAWVTPERRFEEVADIADRLRGEGPILVNEREEWDYYLLRDQEPTESWGAWQRNRGLKTGDARAPLLPHTPDFDNYHSDFLQRFPLLLERKGPAGSRPPVNYEPIYETDHYRVWRRLGAPPQRHLALGVDGFDYTGILDCRRPEVMRLLRASRRLRGSLVAAVPPTQPLLVLGPDAWRGHEPAETPPPPAFITRRGGTAAVNARLPVGRYDAWIQGSFGPGVQLFVAETRYGGVFGDLGLPSAWHHLGQVNVATPDVRVALQSLDKPAWQSGSERSETTGRLVFVRRSGPSRTITVKPRRGRSLCGRRLDWVELPAG